MFSIYTEVSDDRSKVNQLLAQSVWARSVRMQDMPQTPEKSEASGGISLLCE